MRMRNIFNCFLIAFMPLLNACVSLGAGDSLNFRVESNDKNNTGNNTTDDDDGADKPSDNVDVVTDLSSLLNTKIYSSTSKRHKVDGSFEIPDFMFDNNKNVVTFFKEANDSVIKFSSSEFKKDSNNMIKMLFTSPDSEDLYQLTLGVENMDFKDNLDFDYADFGMMTKLVSVDGKLQIEPGSANAMIYSSADKNEGILNTNYDIDTNMGKNFEFKGKTLAVKTSYENGSAKVSKDLVGDVSLTLSVNEGKGANDYSLDGNLKLLFDDLEDIEIEMPGYVFGKTWQVKVDGNYTGSSGKVDLYRVKTGEHTGNVSGVDEVFSEYDKVVGIYDFKLNQQENSYDKIIGSFGANALDPDKKLSFSIPE